MNLYKKTLVLFVVVFTTLIFSSCSKDSDFPNIEEYIQEKGLNTQTTSSGLQYIIEAQGTAPNPTLSSSITINYNGYLLNGESFDSGSNVTFALLTLIQGWQEGLQLIGSGGKIKLLIPSNLAYGSRGSGSIPPNTDLGFDIDLISVQ
ncbi:MAG: FKBP-type peptidyl-prolyl cis-trans isomerase [Saprospiraceae bacterium]